MLPVESGDTLRERAGHRAHAGDLVEAREALWRVLHVRGGADAAAIQILSLRGADDRNRWQECTLLDPFDRVTPRPILSTPRVVSRRRWMRTLGTLVSSGSEALAALADARVRLLAYQVEPLLAILRGVASRVLIADGVGLGKTIQAALVLRELTSRIRTARVLVVVPAGLRDQWRRELRARVGLDSHILDAHTLAARVRELPADINPWAQPGVSIVSLDFIKQAVVLHGLSAVVWDALVVDEAHALTPGTDRATAAHLLARHSRIVLLLTATPHDGSDAAFDTLCNIGRHASDAAGAADDDRIAVFRRTRQSLGLPTARRVHVLRVQPTPAERHLQDLLTRYITRVERERERDHDRDGEKARDRERERRRESESQRELASEPVALAMMVLQKRANSSAWSLARSLERRLALLSDPPAEASRSAQQRLPFDDASDADDGNTGTAEDCEPLASLSTPGLVNAHAERAWLSLLIRAAYRAAARESKLRALQRLLKRIREPVIIYTEYRDTLTHITASIDRRCVLLHGGMTREAREDSLRAFTTGKATVLLATDAAGEGLNLQHRCRVVINIELPWNPNRLEQRLGRVDRLGQSKTVHAIHLVYASTPEETLLETLNVRIDHITAALNRGERATCVWPTLSAEARDVTRTLERVRAMRAVRSASGSGALASRDPLIELDLRSPWLATARRQRRGPLAALAGGVLFLWRTRLRGSGTNAGMAAAVADAGIAGELLTPIQVRGLRRPWPIPSAAQDAMRRTLDRLAHAAMTARHERERPFRERAARRGHAIAGALREMRIRADARTGIGPGFGFGLGSKTDAHADAREPLLFSDITADRTARVSRPWQFSRGSIQPPAPAADPSSAGAAAAASSDPASAFEHGAFDHALVLVLAIP